MSQIRSGSEPAAATLVGSLVAFPLLDVLDLLSRTGRTGELQVVGHGIDRRIWVDRGDLVDTSGSGAPGNGIFELACIEDGWFYFTLADATPNDTGRTPVSAVIGDLTPQVTEWHSLLAFLPFDATVRMSTSTPADEVHIRADQWQLLGLVGAGREVREVVAASALHPLDTLRTLRELADGYLVSVEPAGGATVHELVSAPEDETADNPLAGEVPVTQSVPEPREELEPAEQQPRFAAPPVPVPAVDAGAPSDGIQGSVMPPPITGDPWSTPLFTSPASHSGDEST
jgi:hypothetical protein